VQARLSPRRSSAMLRLLCGFCLSTSRKVVELLKPNDVARQLAVSRAWVYEAARTGGFRRFGSEGPTGRFASSRKTSRHGLRPLDRSGCRLQRTRYRGAESNPARGPRAPAPELGLERGRRPRISSHCSERSRSRCSVHRCVRRAAPGIRADQSIEPAGTIHSLRWPVTAAIRSKSAS